MPRNPSIASATFVAPDFEPIAVSLDQAAELLGKPLEEIQAAAAQMEPYPSPRWLASMVTL